MTDRTRFIIAVTGLILSVIVFLLFTFIPQLAASAKADFWQGFSGGIALGSFLAVLHYGNGLRKRRA
ncbi:hypothetical protein [Mucilaginibacter glaciei]|uniref:Uncharacterized protein n=1 Tax=Mucilaginibacter glaciei TaxID=2772109 RepID=A0A926S1K8_9SPHI|nr:hypothetical protein [Mucilaginibacter glaciei]MBD1394150.1 hypothetical protein [Mucilaginibacter glaciei]